MAIKEHLDELMERKMDRGEFLRLAIVSLAGIIGLARFMGMLDHSASNEEPGYGSGMYGGSEDRAAFLKKQNQ